MLWVFEREFGRGEGGESECVHGGWVDETEDGWGGWEGGVGVPCGWGVRQGGRGFERGEKVAGKWKGSACDCRGGEQEDGERGRVGGRAEFVRWGVVVCASGDKRGKRVSGVWRECGVEDGRYVLPVLECDGR